jgi:nucleotide-binding universal stress UspA family protein
MNMAENKERKILVAIGNTGLDNTTINYLINLFKDSANARLHLLTIIPLYDVPESRQLLDDIEMVALSHPAALKKRSESRKHLSDLEKKLRDAGFTEEQIQSESFFSYGSVSAALLHQGQAGAYDAIVLGKRDLSLLEKMISGSISSDLWRKDHSVPLWLVSGNPQSRDFLVPVDCSIHTLNAVDHLGFMLQGSTEAQITIFHSCSLLADEDITPREKFHARWGKEWCDQHLQGDAGGHFHFQATEQILRESGIPAANIHMLEIKSGIEPAQMIVREIRKKSYSTIVMGRRLDKEKNIFKGVSDRVLANVHDVALCVVG